jgi:glycosyltransferase involved in cell wall biosynthesis
MPALSVLLPVRDPGVHLTAALASLWRQSFRDFEVIAVDDGSADGSGEVLERAASREPRLRVFHTAALGLPAALNTALRHARAPLVARQDADDLSHRRRFERQLAALASHPCATIMGCRVRLFPSAEVGAGMRRWAEWHNRLLTHEAMQREVLIDSPLAHGTLVAHRADLERVGGWAERGWPEDVDLWIRLLDAGTRFAKIGESLYAWRQHPGSATRCSRRYARDRFHALRCDAVRRRFLRGRTRFAIIGVGTSLSDWHEAFDTDASVERIEARRPHPELLQGLKRPAILVYGAATARERWRGALMKSGKTEGRDFIFVC